MLTDTLNTNQVKNSNGTEIEFQHQQSIGRSRTFSKIGESPALPHRIEIAHQETGDGLNRIRRTKVGVTKFVTSEVDPTKITKIRCTMTFEIPEGHLTSMAEPTNVFANCISCLASTGADTVIKFDGTGTFAAAALSGSI